ncbi:MULTISPECIES: ABC transporter substrate-binding protein [Clostridia]|uniref:ABC transporter substrate-binding protein n=1 Tax=Clostridia TaxID=186801 RepID=UPI001314F591|nr:MULTISPECIES: ABC transporter substrate-binding protein [Clostridia]
MKLIDYYLQLFVKFSNGVAFQEVKLTRAKISKELQCTERTVTNILNKLVDKKWIERNKGEGRGNSTTIIFLKTMEEMLDYFERLAPNYDDILRLISLLDMNALYIEKEQVYTDIVFKLFGLKVGSMTMENEEKNDYEHLKIPYFRSFYSLDPSAVERRSERHLVEQIFNTLVTYNKPSGKIVPNISHYWKQDNDGKEWTFYIRKGIHFHNNKILTAKDVKFSFERLRNTSEKWIVRHLNNISCLGNYVVRFEFSQPMNGWDILLSSPKCSIIPENYSGKSQEEFAKYPVGTGPYMVRKHDKYLLKLMAHVTYFQGRAFIDEISIFVLPTMEKYFNANKMGHKPLFYIPFSIEESGNEVYQNIQQHNLSIKYLMWNMKKENVKVNSVLRRKISSIINKDKLIGDLGYPRFQTANSVIDPENAYISNSLINQDIDYKEPLILMTYQWIPNQDNIKWLRREFEEVGVKLHIVNVPYSRFIEESKQADIVLSELVFDNSREVSAYNLFLSGSSVFSNLYHSDKDIYQFIDKAMREKQRVKRMQLLKGLEESFINQGIIIPLYSTFEKAIFHKNLMGISLNTMGLVPFERLFFRKN